MIHLDTSVLIDVFTGEKPSAPRLRQLLNNGERITLACLVLFEWRRGPRIPEQIDAQEALFPSNDAVPFGSAEAIVSAEIYKRLKKPRGREVDIAIAACAIAQNAELWTANRDDFKDIPDLRLLRES